MGKSLALEWLKSAKDDLEVIKKILDELYIDSRYPGNFGLLPNGKPTLEDADEFYTESYEVYTQIYKIIEG